MVWTIAAAASVALAITAGMVLGSGGLASASLESAGHEVGQT